MMCWVLYIIMLASDDSSRRHESIKEWGVGNLNSSNKKKKKKRKQKGNITHVGCTLCSLYSGDSSFSFLLHFVFSQINS